MNRTEEASEPAKTTTRYGFRPKSIRGRCGIIPPHPWTTPISSSASSPRIIDSSANLECSRPLLPSDEMGKNHDGSSRKKALEANLVYGPRPYSSSSFGFSRPSGSSSSSNNNNNKFPVPSGRYRVETFLPLNSPVTGRKANGDHPEAVPASTSAPQSSESKQQQKEGINSKSGGIPEPTLPPAGPLPPPSGPLPASPKDQNQHLQPDLETKASGVRCDSPYPEDVPDGMVRESLLWQRRPHPHDGPIFRHPSGDPCQKDSGLLGKRRRRSPAAQHLAFPRASSSSSSSEAACQPQPLSCDALVCGAVGPDAPPAGIRRRRNDLQQQQTNQTSRLKEPVYSKFRACLEIFAKGFAAGSALPPPSTSPKRHLQSHLQHQQQQQQQQHHHHQQQNPPQWTGASFIPTPTQKLPLSSRLRWEPNYRAGQQQHLGDSSSVLPPAPPPTTKNTEENCECCQTIITVSDGEYLPTTTTTTTATTTTTSNGNYNNNRGSFSECSDRSSDIATSSVSLKCDSDSEVSSVVSEVSGVSESSIHVPSRQLHVPTVSAVKTLEEPAALKKGRVLHCSSHSLHSVKPLCAVPVLDVIGQQQQQQQHPPKFGLDKDSAPVPPGDRSNDGGDKTGGTGDFLRKMDPEGEGTRGAASKKPPEGTGSKPKRRVRPKPDIPAYLNLCRNKTPSPPPTPERSEHDERTCMSDGERCDVENLENLLSSLNFSKFRLGGAKVRKVPEKSKKKEERPRCPTFGRNKNRAAKVEKLRELTERLKPSSPERVRKGRGDEEEDDEDEEYKLAQTTLADQTGPNGAAGFSPPPPEEKVSFIIGCMDEDTPKTEPGSPSNDNDTKEDDIFEESRFNLGKLNSRIMVGSYAQRTIPFRSASFSKVDISSDGKYTKSSRSPIALKPMAFSFNRDGSPGTIVGSATLPRKKYSDVRGGEEVAPSVNLGEKKQELEQEQQLSQTETLVQESGAEREEGVAAPMAGQRRSLKKEVSFDKEEDLVLEAPCYEEEEEEEDPSKEGQTSVPDESASIPEEKAAVTTDDSSPTSEEACPPSTPNMDSFEKGPSSPTTDGSPPEAFAAGSASSGKTVAGFRLSDREEGSRTSSLDESAPESDGGAGTQTELSDEIPEEVPKEVELEVCVIQVEPLPAEEEEEEEEVVVVEPQEEDWTTAVELKVDEPSEMSRSVPQETWSQPQSVESEDGDNASEEAKEPRKLRASTSLEEEVSEKHSLSVRPLRCRAHTMTKERSSDHGRDRIYSGGSELCLLSPSRRDGGSHLDGGGSHTDLTATSQARCRIRTVSPSPINFDSDSSINSDRGVPRSPHGPRRYSKRPLRGPYGEMLEAEMSKSELNKIFAKSHLSEELSFLRDLTNMRDTKSSSPRCSSPVSPAVCQGVAADPWLRSGPLHASHSLDDSQLKVGYHSSSIREPPKRKISANIPYSPPSDSQLDSAPSQTLTVSHHRTASSPSQLQIFAEGFTSEDEPELVELMPKASLYDSLPSDTESANNNVARSASVKRRRDTRTHVVGELYDTERSYVESLQTLVTKYLQPLKSPENSGLIDAGLVDEIFYQVPAILAHHEVFLDDLRKRLESWNTKQRVGDVFLEAFTKQPVIETYTAFINNWKNAKEAIKVASQAKPAFARFLEAKSREHTGKLALDSLLIMPVQRIPRYELLIKELLKHTEKDHPDHALLLEAQKEVHDLAVKINCVERETLESEQQLQTLKELESLVEGLVNVVSPERTFIRHDLVTMAAGQGTRKERCLFLFSDLLVITSIKRKSATIRKPSTSCQGSLTSSLEANKYKLLMKIPLDDLEIAKSKDENLKRLLKEVATLEEDVATLAQIVDLTSALHCPHAALEEAARELLTVLHRQLGERQAVDSQLTFLELTLTTQDGVENMSVVFTSPEKRASWEEAFHEAKQKLVLSADRRPPPEFLHPLPIRKTRAGLQFTCASPTLGLNTHQLRDVWVCNSDGFVGQVCVLSLQPDPTVTSCNGVCNARILAIASIPAPPNSQESGTSQRRSAFNDSGKTAISISVEDMDDGGNNIQLDSSSSDDDQDSTGDDAEEERKRGPETSNDATSITSETSSNYDVETTATMWLGTEDGNIHVYNCSDNIRIKKNKIRMQHNASVQGIIYIDNKVFVALANGQIMVYARDSVGVWNTTDPSMITVSTVSMPVTRMLAVAGKLWCSCQNTVRILDTNTLDTEYTFLAHPESHRTVTSLVSSGLGVWMATQNSASIRLFHATSYEYLGEVNVAPAVTKMLAGCDDIIRQHKAACLRVTALLACKDLLWVGTSAGVVLNLPVPHLTPATSKLTSTPNVTGIPHGHTGHVRFLTCVEMSPAEPRNARGKSMSHHHHHRYSLKNKELLTHQNMSSGGVKMLVISGGDGYEDFRNSSVSEVAGREDSTNHLLLWQV